MIGGRKQRKSAMTLLGRGAVLASLALLGGTGPAQAQLIKIIHTNDLHGYLDHAEDLQRGGYAHVKALIEKLKAESEAVGIPTLVLDAGDNFEGNAYYFANRGRNVVRIADQMGFDAAVLGNHDWLMGIWELDQILGEVQPRTPWLAANFQTWVGYKHYYRHVQPYQSFRKGNVNVAVLGLTTNELFYKWAGHGIKVGNPAKYANAWIPSLRRTNDCIIALTHLGVKGDRKLIKGSSGIDLVVGGHSHTTLKEPLIETAFDGKQVAFVQSGKHGENVGSLLVDCTPGQPLQVVKYELVPVTKSTIDGPFDRKLLGLIRETVLAFKSRFGTEWLQHQVGHSEVRLEVPSRGPTVFGNLVAESFRKAGHADAAIDFAVFNGVDQPAGPITREKIIRYYPRTFELDPPFGMTVWSAGIKGFIIPLLLKFMVNEGYMGALAGLDFKTVKNQDGKYEIVDVKMNGEKILPHAVYRFAMAEGMIRGALEITPLAKLIFLNAKDSRVPIWTAIEHEVARVGTIAPAPAPLPNPFPEEKWKIKDPHEIPATPTGMESFLNELGVLLNSPPNAGTNE